LERSDSTDRPRYHYFLGGRDLEMVTIRELLEGEGQVFDDRALPWGAKASAYRGEIEAAIAAGETPVLIELDDDLGLGARAVHFDHHGARSGLNAPTSLHQVFELIGLPRERWTRRYDLVAANDRGWIPELRAIGASDDEIRAIREEDRRAQGVTEEEEAEAARACEAAERLDDPPLFIVRLGHTRTAPVTDRIAFDNDPSPDTLVLSQSGGGDLAEANFSGNPAIVRKLAAALGGWHGVGFWGHGAPVPYDHEIIEVIRNAVHDLQVVQREGGHR
jgi:hypothetical protein